MRTCRASARARLLKSEHGYVLTPGRYVGAEDVEDDGEPFEEKLTRLISKLSSEFADSAKLEAAIRKSLRWIGHEF